MSWKVPRIPLLANSSMFNFAMTMAYVKQSRIVSIEGRPGGYKTSLSLMIALHLWREHYIDYIFTNFDCVWADDLNIPAILEKTDPYNNRLGIIFDEAGQFFNSSSQVKQLKAAIRKLNLYFIAPSAEPPTRRFSRLYIEPLQIFDVIGLPLVRYRTTMLGPTRRDSRISYFYWWQPSCTFGLYDTKQFPATARGLDVLVMALKDRIISDDDKQRMLGPRKRTAGFAPSRKLPPANVTMLDPSPYDAHIHPDGDVSEIVEKLEEAVEGYGDLSKELSGVGTGKKSKVSLFG